MTYNQFWPLIWTLSIVGNNIFGIRVTVSKAFQKHFQGKKTKQQQSHVKTGQENQRTN